MNLEGFVTEKPWPTLRYGWIAIKHENLSHFPALEPRI